MAHCSRGESKANVDAMGKGGNHPAVSSRVHALISGGGENNFRRALCTAGYFLLSSTANIQQQSKSRAHHLLLLSAHLHLNRTLLSVPSPSRWKELTIDSGVKSPKSEDAFENSRRSKHSTWGDLRATPHFLPHSPFLSHFVAMVATSETAVARRQRTSQSFQSFSFFRRWLFIMFFCFHESLSLSPDPPSISVCINIFLRWWQRRPDVALLHCAFFTPPAICVLSSGASCEGVLTSQHALWRVFAKLSCIVLLSSLPVRISRAFGKPVGLYICRECFRSHTNVSDQTRTFPTGSLNELFEGSFWHACVWRGRWPSLDCCFLGRGRKSGVFEYGTPIFSGGCVEKSSLTSFRWAFALNDPLDPTPVLYKFDVQVFCWCTPFSRLVFTAFMESWAHVISIW